MSPILDVPAAVTKRVLLSGDAHVELYRGEVDGKPVALRLVKFPANLRPIVDPKLVMQRTQEIAAGLGLSATAALLSVESMPGGLALTETWGGDRPLLAGGKLPLRTLAKALGPVLADLDKLHQARKWHGGIRPSRVLEGKSAACLIALPWAVALSGMVAELSQAFDPRTADQDKYRAPELATIGMKAMGPAADVYAIGRLLAAGAEGALPPRVASTVSAALSADPGARPRIADITHALLA
ncbi:MAG: hypothetical protein U1E65_20230 [Myxococcota bacterium]